MSAGKSAAESLVKWWRHKRTLSAVKETTLCFAFHAEFTGGHRWLRICCGRFEKFIKFCVAPPLLKPQDFVWECCCYLLNKLELFLLTSAPHFSWWETHLHFSEAKRVIHCCCGLILSSSLSLNAAQETLASTPVLRLGPNSPAYFWGALFQVVAAQNLRRGRASP